MGPRLYERIFKHYTKKQWDKYPAELDASVLMRLPCRTTTDDRYFGDQWQALPLHGYTRIFENMLLNDPNITLRLGVDYFKERAAGTLPDYGMLVDTGPIDAHTHPLTDPSSSVRHACVHGPDRRVLCAARPQQARSLAVWPGFSRSPRVTPVRFRRSAGSGRA